jgi:hypothetical protein
MGQRWVRWWWVYISRWVLRHSGHPAVAALADGEVFAWLDAMTSALVG